MVSYLKNYKVVYPYKKNLYINLTNRCPVKCSYCIKYRWDWQFRGYNLFLPKEPSYEEIISELNKYMKKNQLKEVVFCGYGEPLLRANIVKKVALWVKKNFPNIIVRINTNGLSNITKKNVLKELQFLVDVVSVSLNAHDSKTYNKLHETKIKQPFKKILQFIRDCKKYIPKVIITTIRHPEIDINKVKNIAKKLKVKFRTRKYLTKYEPR